MKIERLLFGFFVTALGVLLLAFLLSFAEAEGARGQEVWWRCWAEKKVPHGEAACTAVFSSDSKERSRRYAVQLCEDECGGRCYVAMCAPHRRGE